MSFPRATQSVDCVLASSGNCPLKSSDKSAGRDPYPPTQIIIKKPMLYLMERFSTTIHNANKVTRSLMGSANRCVVGIVEYLNIMHVMLL
jgi:hypothetical protein